MDRESEEAQDPLESYRPRPWPEGWTSTGVIELLEPLVNESRRSRIAEVLRSRLESVTVLMDAPRDPHNGAAILRSCDAFGIQEVHVIPRREAFLASNLVSKGAERWVDVVQHSSPTAAIDTLHDSGFELVATHPQGELLPEALAELPRVALVLGNEHDGICDELTQSAGRSVRIPMVGFVESLNVSVSAAILLRAATLDRPGDLDLATHADVYAQALVRSLQRSRDILAAASPR